MGHDDRCVGIFEKVGAVGLSFVVCRAIALSQRRGGGRTPQACEGHGETRTPSKNKGRETIYSGTFMYQGLSVPQTFGIIRYLGLDY